MKKNFFLLVLLISCSINNINAQILAWQFGTPASLGNEATYNATTVHPNVFSSFLGRGTLTPSALARAFSSTAFTAAGTKAQAITNNQYFQFQAQANIGYKLNLSTLDYKVRRSSTGPNAFIWQYSIDGINFFDIGSDISYTATITEGDVQAQLNLSSIPALQNVNNGTTVTFRLYAWGASAVGGTFAIGRTPSATATNVLLLNGTVDCILSPIIGAIATPSTLCSGESTILSGSGASSYVWTNGIVSPTNGISFVPANTSIYTVTGTDALGCTGVSTVNVTVNSLPTITATPATLSICAGQSTTLNGGGGSSYVWSGGITNNISFTPLSSTIYTVTGTDVNGCTSEATSSVTVNSLPTVTSTPASISVCAGANVTLVGGGANSYSWSGGITDNVAFVPITNAIYTVTGTDGNNCSNTATSSVVVNNFTLLGPPNPEILYYKFDGVGTTVPNLALTPPIGTSNATILGTITQGSTGQGGTALVGSGVSATTDYLNTNWAPNLGGGSWTISFWSQGISTNATLYYVFGDIGSASFRCFTNGIAGSGNWILRGAGLTDILIAGGAQLTPTLNTYVYDATLNNVKAYLNGVLVNTVTQTLPNLTGTGPLKVMGYSANIGAPLGGKLDEFRIYNRALLPAEVLQLVTLGSPFEAIATPGVVCAGSSVSLNASGANSYLWNPGAISGSSITANPLSTTVYTITGSDVNGCTSNTNVTVNVNPLPTVTATPATVSVCQNDMTTLAGGGASTYVWTGGITDNTPFAVTSSNVYQVTGTDANGCTNTATSSVTMNALPTVTATPAAVTVCAGQSTTLTGGGASTYVWTGGITDATPFAVIASNVYQVTGTDVNGCSNTATSNVTMNAAPNISTTPSATATKCDGAGVMLTASSSTAGTTFEWNPGAVANASITIPGATSGTYTATVTDGNTCTATASVIVTNTPASGILTQATAANAQSNPGNVCSIQIQPNDGTTNSYFDASCNLIASVVDAPGANALGNINTCVTVDGSVQLVNGQPYLKRWYEITPTSNGPADVILYLTQDDFDDYNAAPAAAGWPPLPIAPLTNYANVRITKNDAGVLSVITPTIMWDAVNNRYALSFPVTGFSQFRVHSINNANAPLPVTYKMFTARKENTVDVLDWITGSEENNKQFNVERSANGEEFTRIGVVATKAPNGNSQVDINYTFVDAKPMTGHNYYRLAQEDIDGKQTYSETIDLIWGANGSTITMYPNPTTDVLNVDINATMASNITIRVMDMSGRTVKTTEARTEQGVNNVKINLSDVSSGIYNVQLVENGKLIATERVNKK